MTGDELAQLFAEVYQQYTVAAVGDGEFSTRQLAAQVGVSYNQAAGVIRRAVAAGDLVEVGARRFPDGRTCACYRKATRNP